ncbi:GPP34 family phosphoprotein [Kribbella sp. NPDC026611]|uniref:GOLPH3/VPS74 family protein n=1 Tax=Kribbella sp. NPDC026611 TaxID=3154911 RepID=UPI0033C797A1
MSRTVVMPLRRPERSRQSRKVVAYSNMRAPESLPARLFLLAYDPTRGRLTSRQKLGKLLRAAALTDLQLTGKVADDNGRVRVLTGAEPTDPVLAGFLAEIRAVGPRRWRHWIDRRPGLLVRQVRDELERARLIKVEPRRILPDRISLRQPLVRRQILQAAHDTLRPSRLVSRVDLRDASIVVLAATADLRTVVTRERRNRHKDRLAQLAVRIGPVVPALKKALQSQSAG